MDNARRYYNMFNQDLMLWNVDVNGNCKNWTVHTTHTNVLRFPVYVYKDIYMLIFTGCNNALDTAESVLIHAHK